MPNGESPQGIYSPLSQSMTDSESEEEIHSRSSIRIGNSSNNHHNNFRSGSNNLMKNSSSTVTFHQNSIEGNSMADIHCNNFTNFNSDGEDNRHNHTDADNVAILGMHSKREPMSPTRKCCFIISLMICVLTIILFIWVVPCNEGSTCPAYVDRVKTHNWLNNYTKIELKGVVNVVDGLRSWEKNLIFMYRGDKFFPEFQQSNRKQNGIISLIGNSGRIAWFDEMPNEPIAIDCTLLDVDKNGKPDCLVIDEFGQLDVINPISGQWQWSFKEKSFVKVDVLNFPLVLPDLDGDGVYELLYATTESEETRNSIRIISGHNGIRIGNAYKIRECTFIHKFQLNEGYMIGFNCINNDTEVQHFKTLSELYSLITNKSLGKKLIPVSKLAQHKLYGQRKETEAQRSIYSLSGKELIVDNKGKCPDNCNVTFTLSEEKNGKTHIIRNFSGSMMYGMVPAQLSFKAKNGKNKIGGFVMKFWEWSKHTGNISSNGESVEFFETTKQRHKRSEKYHSMPFNKNEFNLFDNFIQKRNSFTMPTKSRLKRDTNTMTNKQNKYSIYNHSNTNIFLNNYKMRLIRETVVLIIFNSADIHIENTSQSNIVQFCRKDTTNNANEMICQPDLNYQENSILIADLDQDGSQELLSYYTTFVNRNENGNSGNKKDWKLVTYVTMLRLESELPILYEEFKRN